jgi:methanogenic corrinoid protein MtbC1
LTTVESSAGDAVARISIGGLARSTGIPVETLRTWEARYGFPVPERRPSGHRVYPTTIIPRLRRISQALARGHRASYAVPATDGQLDQLLSVGQGETARSALDVTRVDLEALLETVETFDTDRLTRMLLSEAARRDPVDLVDRLIGPLLKSVGEGWASGRFTISHEHFLSERVGDLLRTVRLPYEDRAKGPVVVLATLPGEQHGLGLHMAALVMAEAGCRIVFLGTEAPPAQVAAICRQVGARAAALSVSSHAQGRAMSTKLAQLRRRLPNAVALVAGGDGSTDSVKGVHHIVSFRELRDWARQL